MSKVVVVAGAQFGSEGKGHVAAQLIQREQRAAHPVLNVRVAGPNAGHTVVDRDGRAFALRTVPVGAALDPCRCAIAPGSEIELAVLRQEVEDLRAAGHRVDMVIAAEATVLTDEHKQAEVEADMAQRLGSTAKGIGACRSDRVWRTATRFGDSPEAVALAEELGFEVIEDWVAYMDDYLDHVPQAVVVEGTQGYGLGLHAGHYPQCTSSDTRGIDFLAMAGVNPWHAGVHDFKIVLATRVYPIRVAGNSGPLEGETTWEELGLPEERTTVTHKVRRVGEFNPEAVNQAIHANGGEPTVEIAMTMVDQVIPEVKDADGDSGDWASAQLDSVTGSIAATKLFDYLTQVRAALDAPITMVTTSPSTALY